MSKTPTRIYVVKDASGKASLVNATSPSQAIRHVSRTQYSAHVATQNECVQYARAGVDVEEVGAEGDETAQS